VLYVSDAKVNFRKAFFGKFDHSRRKIDAKSLRAQFGSFECKCARTGGYIKKTVTGSHLRCLQQRVDCKRSNGRGEVVIGRGQFIVPLPLKRTEAFGILVGERRNFIAHHLPRKQITAARARREATRTLRP
jgi:hypothetical protein